MKRFWFHVIGDLLTPLPFLVELHALCDVLVILAAMCGAVSPLRDAFQSAAAALLRCTTLHA